MNVTVLHRLRDFCVSDLPYVWMLHLIFLYLCSGWRVRQWAAFSPLTKDRFLPAALHSLPCFPLLFFWQPPPPAPAQTKLKIEPQLHDSASALMQQCRQAERRQRKDKLPVPLALLTDSLAAHQIVLQEEKSKYPSCVPALLIQECPLILGALLLTHTPQSRLMPLLQCVTRLLLVAP